MAARRDRDKDDPGQVPAGGAAAPASGGAGRTAGAGGRSTTPAATGRTGQSTAALLTAWQVVYALTAPTSPSSENYASVSLLLTLVLSVGAVVLGIVALGQRAQPRWPAPAATAVGGFAFIVAVATWIGTLMA